MKLATVKRIYHEINTINFGGVLEHDPLIKFTRSKIMHAFYNGISLQFNLTGIKGFEAVKELVYHEMVHQYIYEFLQLDCRDHGHEFKTEYSKFCYDIAIDTRYLV